MSTDTRTFKEIWSSWDSDERGRFLDKCQGPRDSTIRCYGSGARRAKGPSLQCLVIAFRKIGINVGDGQFLFPKSTTNR